MTVYKRGRALRDWLVSTSEAARAVHVTENRIRSLSPRRRDRWICRGSENACGHCTACKTVGA